MREFTLENKNGKVYRLNDLQYFFHDPKGLGYNLDVTYQRIGNGFETLSKAVNQQTITGIIRFKNDDTNNAYKKYGAFTRFLQDAPLVLRYRAENEYCIDVMPESVDKTEINLLSGMDVEIRLKTLSLWYQEFKREDNTIIGLEVEEQEGTIPAIGGCTDWNYISVHSESAIESPCHIWARVADGSSFTSVAWRSYVNESEKYDNSVAQCDIAGRLSNITLNSLDTLHIRTDTNPYRIYKVSADGVETDLYGKSDFSTKRFINIKKGLNEILFANDFGDEFEMLGIEGKILYETV